MRSLRGVLVIGAALVAIPFAPVHAKWPEQQRREVVAGCMKICQAEDASSIGGCDPICSCVAYEAEKAYPDPQVFVRLRQAKDPAFVRRFRYLEDICYTR